MVVTENARDRSKLRSDWIAMDAMPSPVKAATE
jgi:hypothetical protein